MRLRGRRKKPNTAVLALIGKIYEKLYSVCDCCNSGNYAGCSREDIFQETIMFVSHDADAVLTTEEAFIAYFKHKYNMITFQVIMDSRELKEINYADNIQTKEE